KEFASQQPARVLRNSPQPLLGGLLVSPMLRVLRLGRAALLGLLSLVVRCLLLVTVLRFVAGLFLAGAVLAVAFLRVPARLLLFLIALVLRLFAGLLILALRAARLTFLILILLLLAAALRLTLLRRRRMLVEVVLHEIAVVRRVRVLRIELERAVVGADR